MKNLRTWCIPLAICCCAAAVHAEAIFTKDRPFDETTVSELARKLAAKPYNPPPKTVSELEGLSYDEYRAVRFRPQHSIWINKGLSYRMQMFLSGFFFKNQVEIATVSNGQAKHISYLPSMFTVDPPAQISLPKTDVGFSGFRLHTQLNKPNIWDEIAVFQGASYFRSLGKGQVYGLSSRGLALGTGSPNGEEFPIFRAFWVEEPSANSNLIKVDALLDSPSITGAYQFVIRSGDETIMDVHAILYPRVEVKEVGIAPGTSMYLFSSSSRKDVDDFRPQVHDSDGLLMINGKNERLWRPLLNPNSLQISAFMDHSPVGFGLIQRDRNFFDYQDLEANYEQRPSLWVEPQGDWGAGEVMLVEIPTSSEVNDNIVAFWRPEKPLKAHKKYEFSYRLTWGNEPDKRFSDLSVVATRVGRNDIQKTTTAARLFVIDYAAAENGAPLPQDLPRATVSASTGKIKHLTVQHHPFIKGYRVSFEFEPKGEELSELRLNLATGGGAAETWMYRWAPK